MQTKTTASLLIPMSDYALLQGILKPIDSIVVDDVWYQVNQIALGETFFTRPEVLDEIAENTQDPFDEMFVKHLKDVPVLIQPSQVDDVDDDLPF